MTRRKTKTSKPTSQSPPLPRNACVLAAAAGLVAYLLAFYACPLPSLDSTSAELDTRGEFLLWLVLGFDEVASGWFGTPPEISVVDRLPVVSAALAILATATCLGWLLVSACRADRQLTRLETFVFSTAVGLNLVSTYVLLVGLAGWLQCRALFLVPGPIVLALAGGLWWRRKPVATRPNERKKKQKPKEEDANLLDPRWLWLAAPFVGLILLGSMLPPIEFDVREYHLQVPKEFFEQGYVGFLPHNVYGNMPLGTEMLSLAAMAATGNWWLGALVGKTLIGLFAPLTALGLFAAGRRLVSTSAGVVAAVVYLSIPWIVQVSTLGLVEGASACYLFLAVYAILLWQPGRFLRPGNGRSPRHAMWPRLLLAGYLAGGAVACKYPAVLFVVVPLAGWIVVTAAAGLPPKGNRARPGWRSMQTACRPLALFLLAVAIGCGAWFAKNEALAGNPTYPLLAEAFGGNTWTPEKNQQWNAVHRPHDFSPKTFGKCLVRVGLASEWLSPILIPLAALALLVRRSRRLVLVLLAYFAFVIAGWWLLTHRIDRFWIPALPVVALAAGVGACWSRERIWRYLLVGLMLVGCVSGFVFAVCGAGGYNRYFVALARLRVAPERVDPWHAYLNAEVAGGRVLLVGEAEVFDLEVPLLYNTCFDDSIFERLVADRTPSQVLDELTALGITHLYVDWDEIARYRQPGNYGFTPFVQPERFEKLVSGGVLEPLPSLAGRGGRAYRVTTSEIHPWHRSRSETRQLKK